MAKKKAKVVKNSTIITVDLRTSVTVQLDNDLVPDDEWRSMFYNLHTLEDVAKHFAYNHVANRVNEINRLDGFADRRIGAAKVLEVTTTDADD